MNCHTGVDSYSVLAHTLEVTVTNTHDITETSKLIQGDDTDV